MNTQADTLPLTAETTYVRLKKELHSLPRAKEHLTRLEKTAIGRGIKPPSLGQPVKTFGEALDRAVDIELLLMGATAGTTPPAAATKAPAPENTEALLARARSIVTMSRAQTMVRPREAVHTPPAMESMSISELERAIGVANKNGDVDLVSRLYRQLGRRRAGVPTQKIIEATNHMTELELGAAIEAEKDPDQRQMLYSQLIARRAGK
jgi:hypothetical protein